MKRTRESFWDRWQRETYKRLRLCLACGSDYHETKDCGTKTGNPLLWKEGMEKGRKLHEDVHKDVG